MANWQSWKNRFSAALVLGAFALTPVAAAPVLSITATPDPAVQGSAVTLAVWITGVSDLYAYQFTLSFDPALIQATSVAEGAFLGTGGSTFFDGGSIDNTGGSVSLVFDTLLGAVPGVTGSGILASFSFDVMQEGITALTFSDVTLLDSALEVISLQIDNSELQTVSGPATVPEPATFALFGLGLAGIAATRHRKAS